MLDPAARNPIGTHVLVGKGLVAGAVDQADQLGCETFQVFTGNPRGWALSEGRPAEDARLRELMAERGTRTFIHAPYLVNLGSPTPATAERSAASVAHNLRRAVEIGAEGVVVHTGSCVDPGTGDPVARYDAAMRQVREALLPLLDTLLTADDAPWVLLEPTAGQGRSLCAGVEDLAPYLAALEHHPRAGICLDTCHVFAAGAPLDEPGGTTATVDRIVEIGGPGRLRLVHANDSIDIRGAFKDRHQRIGEGHIGEQAFVELFAHPATAGVVRPRDAGLPHRRQPRHPAAEAAARAGAGSMKRLATLVLLGVTASWGSSFFMIHDLVERVPPLDFIAVRFAIAGALLLLVAPRSVLRLSPAAQRQSAVLGPVYGVAQVLQTTGLTDTRGQRVRVHHRHVRHRHAAAGRRPAPQPDHGHDLGGRRRRLRRARRPLPRRVLGRVRRGADLRRRDPVRAAHRRARRLGDRAGRARDVDPPGRRRRGDLPGRQRPGGIVLPGSATNWTTVVYLAISRPGSRCSARPGRRPTSRPPGPRS